MDIPTRTWCAVLRYPDLEDFLFGSINMPKDAMQHELLEALDACAATVLPAGYKIVNMVPGQLIWHPDEGD